nr:Uma2 family endonuclease [uncultured Rhodopila sp.]
MRVAARRIGSGAWTKEQFLAWAETRAGEGSYEFDGVRPVAMVPATLGHNEIARTIRQKIRDRLPAGTGCRTYGPQQPLETVGGALREPDAFIACSAQSRSRGVRVYWREPGERAWRREPPDAAGPLLLPEFGIALAFDQIYENVAID